MVSLWSLVAAIALCNKDGLALPKGTKIVIRFDKFEFSVNETVGRLDERDITKSGGADFLNVALTFHSDFIIHKMRLEAIKCKEHYIDCANHRTFEVQPFCGNERAILFFLKIGYVNRELICNFLKGPFVIRNATLNLDNLIVSMAISFDKWWEKSWRWKIDFFASDGSALFWYDGAHQTLLLSSRTRKP